MAGGLRVTLAEKLLLLRRRMKLTQERFAAHVGLSQQFVAELERGLKKPSLRSVEKIARACLVPVQWLVDDSEDATWFLEMPQDVRRFIAELDVVPYLQVAKEAKDAGLSPETLRGIIAAIRHAKRHGV